MRKRDYVSNLSENFDQIRSWKHYQGLIEFNLNLRLSFSNKLRIVFDYNLILFNI